ncbi:MAG: putative metalloprotease CJM1_0395 family protein, partial [Planctomycetota bacterium]
RDREVRTHEMAHKNAAGQHATSGPTYSYQTGPDGQKYAVGGSVGIDLSPEDTPEATIKKMEVVRRAALAPAEPSSQDRKVAAQASQIAAQARQEKQQVEADQESEAARLESTESVAVSNDDANPATDAVSLGEREPLDVYA